MKDDICGFGLGDVVNPAFTIDSFCGDLIIDGLPILPIGKGGSNGYAY